jgi:predicted aminopeptidase
MVEAALAHRRGLESRLAAVRELYDGLDALYGRGGEREEVLGQKRAFIERFGERYRELHGRDFDTGGMELNNAYLMTLVTYTGDLSLFRELNEKFDGDLAATVRFVRGIAGDGAGESGRRGSRGLRSARGDPKDAIREYLTGPPS